MEAGNMGLDMYLSRHHYVQRWDHIPTEKQYTVTVEQGGEVVSYIDPAKISYVIEQVGYWRKANQIHHWFVKNVQGGRDECQESYVDSAQLRDLLDLCQRVLTDHSLAGELLPPQEGFFFGGTNLDEYYFGDLESTVEILTSVLTPRAHGDLYYRASW